MDDVRRYELDRDVLRISGPDAISFLQGQLSQDVAGLAVGASAFTFLLEPQGKVSAWGRITRIADDAILFDVDRGFAEAAIARLNRFKLRTKAEIEQVDWPVYADFDWPGFDGADLIGDHADYERRRIEAGVPAMGHEFDANTIPAEAGDVIIEKSVSFTKGCYTGQELVARVDSRGNNTPRRLRLVRIDGGVPESGSELLVDDKIVGKLTSVAASDGGAV